jgi:hypothetical protein
MGWERHATRIVKLKCKNAIVDGGIKVEIKVGECLEDELNKVQLNIQSVLRSKHISSLS